MATAEERAQAIVAKRAENEKDIHLPTLGVDITIRRIGPYDFFVMGVPIPTEIDKSGKKRTLTAKEQEDVARVYFGRGIVSPKVQLDESKEREPGCVYMSDLSEDFGFIAHQLAAFSKFKEAAEAAAGFQEEEPEAEPDAGPDGDQVRGASV